MQTLHRVDTLHNKQTTTKKDQDKVAPLPEVAVLATLLLAPPFENAGHNRWLCWDRELGGLGVPPFLFNWFFFVITGAPVLLFGQQTKKKTSFWRDE